MSGDSRRKQPAYHGVLAGAVSGLLSRLVAFPADTLKARIQLHGAIHDGRRIAPLRATLALYQAEGLLGFYRGFGAVALGAVPAQAVYFGGYELGKRVMPADMGILADMGTGCVAQLVAGVAFTPVDIIKERMQVQTMMRGQIAYANALQAAWSIVVAQGPQGLLRGYWATNCVWLPWNIIYISIYEDLKRRAGRSLSIGDGAPLPMTATGAASMAAASAAAVLTHPADVVKTRLQVLAGVPGAQVSAVSVARDLLRSEGFAGLWTGLGARVLAIGPGAALSWALYEHVKGYLADRL